MQNNKSIEASFHKYTLNFKIPGGTSRGILHQKETYFLILRSGDRLGIGECGIFRGLSCDDRPDYEQRLAWVCRHIGEGEPSLYQWLKDFPSIQFGLEQAFLSLAAQKTFDLFPSSFTEGKDEISINGLIWMGDESFMKQQIRAKLSKGFRTLKMKIGAIDFDTELSLLRAIRKEYKASDLELRVDANGAFSVEEAMDKLEQLAVFDLHSIEQPVKAGQWNIMADLCINSPVPIALDEELIGIVDRREKLTLLTAIKPRYIILKPSLTGGFRGSREWIQLSESLAIDWWITSALESNIGLNAIAQFTYILDNKMPQGLGTGSLFTNNIPSPLYVNQGALHYDREGKWSNMDEFLENIKLNN